MWGLSLYIYTHMHIYIHIYVYIYMCIYVYIYIYRRRGNAGRCRWRAARRCFVWRRVARREARGGVRRPERGGDGG